jgi:class 3 adenylate cyclase
VSVEEPHLHLEVGHILFLDIVGYSKLLSDEQKELVQKLNQIVRETEQFRAAEAEGKLTRLPTGDGMVLVFTNNPEAPVECALEISKALQSHPNLKVRMGIHSGPVNPVADVNDQSNLLGAGLTWRSASCIVAMPDIFSSPSISPKIWNTTLTGDRICTTSEKLQTSMA